MRRWVAAVLAGWLVAGLVALSGCGGDASSGTTVKGPDGDIDCADVITGEEGVALSWDTRTDILDVEAVDGSCRLDYQSLGSVTVGELEGTSPAHRRVEDACSKLTVDTDLTADLIGGGTGCVTGLDPATQTGEAELVLLTQDDAAVRVTIDAKAPVDDSHLRAGFRALEREAQAHW